MTKLQICIFFVCGIEPVCRSYGCSIMFIKTINPILLRLSQVSKFYIINEGRLFFAAEGNRVNINEHGFKTK